MLLHAVNAELTNKIQNSLFLRSNNKGGKDIRDKFGLMHGEKGQEPEQTLLYCKRAYLEDLESGLDEKKGHPQWLDSTYLGTIVLSDIAYTSDPQVDCSPKTV